LNLASLNCNFRAGSGCQYCRGGVAFTSAQLSLQLTS
jgi:hypothetical protein